MRFRPPDLPVRWIAMGFLTGACLTVAVGEPVKPTAPPQKLVVILRGDKTVTIEKPTLQLREIAAELSKQTGRTFTLDKTFEADKTPYAVLLNKAPLSHVLAATAYVTNGKWDRHGVEYHLRLPTAREMTIDGDRVGATVDRVADYLGAISPDDNSVPGPVLRALQDLRRQMDEQQTTFPPFPDATMDGWTVRASDHGLNLSYQASQTDGDTTTGQSQSRGWGWGN